MRRLLIVLAAALITAAACPPAWAGNQEVAQQIAASLTASGQLGHDKVGVRFCDGTVWLAGQVRDQQQKDRIAKTVLRMPGVTRVIADELTLGAADQTSTGSKLGSSLSVLNPLRKPGDDDSHAQPVGTTMSASRGAVPTAMMQPVPAPPPAPGTRPMPPAPLPGGEPGIVGNGVPGGPVPMYPPGIMGGPAPMRTDQPSMPATAWPTYAAYPNYAAVTYPKQYSPTAWPYIGPFYPYPQVPLGWRKVSLQWDDGWWMLEFHDKPCCVWWR